MTKQPQSSRWRRFVTELPATAAALAVAATVEVGLHATTLPRLARFLGTPLAGHAGVENVMTGPTTAALTARQKRQIRGVRRVLRHWPFGDTCLRQALIAGQRLRHMSPTLHVGVAKIEGEIRAHAWLVIAHGVLDPLAAAASYLDLSEQPEGPPA